MIPIVIGLILLIILVFKRISILIAAPVSALIMVILSGMPMLDSITGPYMQGFANFTKNNFLLFLTGALFGKVMEDTGAAASVAKFLGRLLGPKRAAWAVILGCALLTYGGVSLFVVVFTMYPVALALFKEANLTRALIPGAIAAGSFTFTAAMFPGSPQIQNIIPTTYLGTDAMAAPVVGTIVGLSVAALIFAYFAWQTKVSQRKNEGFEERPEDLESLKKMESTDTPSTLLSFLPMIVIVVLLNVLKLHIVVSMLAGILLCAVMFYKRISNKIDTFNIGVSGAVMAIINTSAAVGFGTVAQASPGFAVIVDSVSSFQGNPLISLGVATSLVAGATGSGSGGLGIALEALSGRYLEMGINPEIIHRVAGVACLGLDSLPHNGAVITLLTVTGLTHKDGYKHIFWNTVFATTIGLVIAIILGAIFYL